MLLVNTAVCRARGSGLPVERGLLAEGDRDDLLEVTVVQTASGRRSSGDVTSSPSSVMLNSPRLPHHSERCDDNDGTKQVELYAGATDVPLTGSQPLQVSLNPALFSVSIPALIGLRTNALVQ